MIDIKSKNLNELSEYGISLGEKPFRAKQVYDWLHANHACSFDQMTHLSNNLRGKLKADAYISGIKIVKELISKEDDTRKYLLQLDDGNIIESVINLRYD